MKHPLPVFLALLLLSAGVVQAQPPQLPEPLYAETFDQRPGNWFGMGADAKVSHEVAPENVKVGDGALRFDYNLAADQVNILVTPIAPPALATLQSISFWVKDDHNASLVFSVQEQGGGRFVSIFSVSKDEWQKVEIAPAEMILQTGKDDPRDADGKLDTSKIENVALLDFGQVFVRLAGGADTDMWRKLGIETGSRTLYLDDVKFSGKPLEPLTPGFLDDFARPQSSWFPLGGVTLKVSHGKSPDQNALEATYIQSTEHIAAFARQLPVGTLKGKTEISFDFLSKRHGKFVFQLEETSGGKYNALVEMSADVTADHKTLNFAEFAPSGDSKDDDGKLDLDQVKQLLIIDTAALTGTPGGQTSLTLSNLRTK